MKNVLIILALVIIIAGIRVATTSPTNTKVQQIENNTPTEPMELVIPKLNIDAKVQAVGLDSKNAMAVPSNSFDVAWYKLGYKPAEKGNAVIAGHYDDVNGHPAVFFELATLQKGDDVIVYDTNHLQHRFMVVSINNYPYDNFPLQQVFGAASQPTLDLITCTGVWDSVKQTYLKRTVVVAH